MVGIFIRGDALKTDSIKRHLDTPPAFFVSVASKELRRCVSSLVATHTPQVVSVASKGLRGLHNYRSGGAFLAMTWAEDTLLGCGLTTDKRWQAAALQSVRTGQPRAGRITVRAAGRDLRSRK
jgi:hypothetical protein